MSFGFKNIGHFFATVAGDIVKGARAVANVMVKVGKAEPEVEAISSLFFPGGGAGARGFRPSGIGCASCERGRRRGRK